MVHLRSSHWSLRDVFFPNAFSSTLTTRALNSSSLRSCKASPCRAALEGLPPSLRELRTSLLVKDCSARGTRSTANLNIHLHCLVLDGVYCLTDGVPVFQPIPAPSTEQLQTVLSRIVQRVLKSLTRKGALIEEHGLPYLADPDADPALASLHAAACTYHMDLKAFGNSIKQPHFFLFSKVYLIL